MESMERETVKVSRGWFHFIFVFPLLLPVEPPWGCFGVKYFDGHGNACHQLRLIIITRWFGHCSDQVARVINISANYSLAEPLPVAMERQKVHTAQDYFCRLNKKKKRIHHSLCFSGVAAFSFIFNSFHWQGDFFQGISTAVTGMDGRSDLNGFWFLMIALKDMK